MSLLPLKPPRQPIGGSLRRPFRDASMPRNPQAPLLFLARLSVQRAKVVFSSHWQPGTASFALWRPVTSGMIDVMLIDSQSMGFEPIGRLDQFLGWLAAVAIVSPVWLVFVFA